MRFRHVATAAREVFRFPMLNHANPQIHAPPLLVVSAGQVGFVFFRWVHFSFFGRPAPATCVMRATPIAAATAAHAATGLPDLASGTFWPTSTNWFWPV